MSQKQLFQPQPQLLYQRSTNEQRMAAPYTVFAKKIDDNDYSWILYSLGRPRNIVWGVASADKSIKVEYGCRWDKVVIINKMVEIRKRNGYLAISTFSKDGVNQRILSELIIYAYQEGTGVQWKDIAISNSDLESMILYFLHSLNYLTDTIDNVRKIAPELALSMLDKPNLTHILPGASSLKIPKDIINAIHDFIGHTPILNSELPEICPTIEYCEENPDIEICNLYQNNFSLL